MSKKKNHISNMKKIEHLCYLLQDLNRYKPELSFSELINSVLGENILHLSNDDLEMFIRQEIDNEKEKLKVFQPINHYVLVPNLTIEKLKEIGFYEGGYLSKFNKPKYSITRVLSGSIECHIEINVETFEFDDFENVLILDDAFGQPYAPFYDESDKVGKGCANIRKKYNEFMDSLVEKGILIKEDK